MFVIDLTRTSTYLTNTTCLLCDSLQAPINDDTAGALLIGMTPTVTSAHIVRAVLESIAFVIKLQYETMVAESGHSVSHIRYLPDLVVYLLVIT